MKTQQVIPNKYLPRKLPINATLLHLFLMYHFNAPEWLWATYIVLAVLVWSAIFKIIYYQKHDKSLINNIYED